MMKAIVLTAGYGRRMRPLTDNNHKTLLPIGNKTILERIINSLRDNQVNDVVIVTGYRSEELKSYVLDKYAGSDLKFTFIHNAHYAETNNIHSLALAMNGITIDKDILLIESDLIYDDTIIKKLIQSPYPNVALVDHFRNGMDGTVVTLNDKNAITHIIPPHLQGENFNFSDKYKTLNIYRFSQEFCDKIFSKLLSYYSSVIDNNCYYELILGILIYMQRETIHAEIVKGNSWTEVDDPNDLRVADFAFDSKKRETILNNSFGGFWNYDILDFCFIRNMYFPNPSMLADMRSNLVNLVRNYGSTQKILNEKLSYFLLCKKENVNLLNGAAQAYPLLAQKFGKAKTLIPTPTFGEYSKHFQNSITYGDEVGIDFNEVEKKSVQADFVVFVNPNNPTGTTLKSEMIFDFARKHPGKTILVDESFIDFSETESILGFLEKEPLQNMIILKSLSKTLGVPGIRLGYIYTCNATFNDFISSQIPVWNSNSVAEYFLEIILKHQNSLQASYKQTMADRERFAELLRELPAVKTVFPSGANFLLVEFKKTPNEVGAMATQLLESNKIYVKNISDKFTGRSMMRLAVRNPEENERLVSALKTL